MKLSTPIILLSAHGAVAANLYRNYTATFNKGVDPASIPGPYEGLQWTHIEPGPYNYAADNCYGVCPHSYPAEAVFGHTYTSPRGAISVFYPRSNVTSFDFYSLWFGCLAESPNAPQGQQLVPSNCTLTINGFKDAAVALPATSKTPDYTAKMVYKPATEIDQLGLQDADMVEFVVPKGKFVGLKTLVMSAVTTPGTGFNSTPAVALDDVHYRTLNVTTS